MTVRQQISYFIIDYHFKITNITLQLWQHRDIMNSILWFINCKKKKKVQAVRRTYWEWSGRSPSWGRHTGRQSVLRPGYWGRPCTPPPQPGSGPPTEASKKSTHTTREWCSGDKSGLVIYLKTTLLLHRDKGTSLYCSRHSQYWTGLLNNW